MIWHYEKEIHIFTVIIIYEQSLNLLNLLVTLSRHLHSLHHNQYVQNKPPPHLAPRGTFQPKLHDASKPRGSFSFASHIIHISFPPLVNTILRPTHL